MKGVPKRGRIWWGRKWRVPVSGSNLPCGRVVCYCFHNIELLMHVDNKKQTEF